MGKFFFGLKANNKNYETKGKIAYQGSYAKESSVPKCFVQFITFDLEILSRFSL